MDISSYVQFSVERLCEWTYQCRDSVLSFVGDLMLLQDCLEYNVYCCIVNKSKKNWSMPLGSPSLGFVVDWLGDTVTGVVGASHHAP